MIVTPFTKTIRVIADKKPVECMFINNREISRQSGGGLGNAGSSPHSLGSVTKTVIYHTRCSDRLHSLDFRRSPRHNTGANIISTRTAVLFRVIMYYVTRIAKIERFPATDFDIRRII